MFVPCWFTLWTSGRFLHHYILLISIEIFLISCLCPFFFLVKCSSISCMYGEVFVSTISLVFLLLMAFLKLVAKIVKLYVAGLPSLLRMHACSAYEPRPHLFIDLYGGYTVFHTKMLEKSFLDNLLIFSELHHPMHICMYHHEGLSFGS